MNVVTGVGVIIVNPQGEILLGKRCGSHAPFGRSPAGIWMPVKPSSSAPSAKLPKKPG